MALTPLRRLFSAATVRGGPNQLIPSGNLWSWLLLALILSVALGLRLHGLNWDSGYGFHPDERSLYMRADCIYSLLTEKPGYLSCSAEHPEIEPGWPSLGVLLDFDRSPLNPHWFPLGSVLIYLLTLLRGIIELFTDIGAFDMRYPGRILSALADVGSVFLVFLLGRRIYGVKYGPWVGLLGAALTALAVIHVQTSHFFRPEPFSALLILATLWAALRMVERRRLRDSLLLGGIVGLAFAPKVSVLPIVLPLLAAYVYRLLDSNDGTWSGIGWAKTRSAVGHALAAGVVSLAVFFAVTPYALLDIANFLGEQAAQTNMARNAGLWPFTIQYVDTPAFIYQFRQTAVWGLGLPLGLFAWLSIPFAALLVWRRTATWRGDLLLLLWVVPSILLLESFEVRFQRYYFALIPVMTLLAARMLLWAPFHLLALPGGEAGGEIEKRWRPKRESSIGKLAIKLRLQVAWADFNLLSNPSRRRYLTAAVWVPVVLVVAATAFYSLAFQRVYANPHPAVAASQWINDNVPSGAVIVSDNHWDEFIPDLYSYQVWQFPAYEPDGAAKMSELGERLAQADYLVFYSYRPYVSVARDPQRFPFSFNYYRKLFGGELGYRLDRTFTTYPKLAGVAFVDDPLSGTGLPRPEGMGSTESAWLALNQGYADDNVVGYDHPQVLLFRNVERLPAETLLAQLVSVSPESNQALKFSTSDRDRQQAGGAWSELFDREGWANRVPVLAWLLVVELIYLAALPLALFLFRPLADRGIILARILGLLTVAYLTWLSVSLGLVEFSREAILLAIAALAALSGLVFWLRRQELIDFLRQRWRLLLCWEVLFLGAFLAFVALRAFNPDLWHPYRGGEKPMELAYFNAVIRSTLLPPYDPWFAGGYLNYYYWGYFIAALPTRLAGIAPTVAFNLAVPLFFALTFTGACSVIYNLAEGARRSRRSGLADSVGAHPVAQAGAEGPEDPAVGSARPWNPLNRATRSPVVAGLTAAFFVAVIGNLDGLFQLLQAIWMRLFGGAETAFSFDFWRSSRMVPNLESFDPGPLAFWVPEKISEHQDISWHITEFPFFTFLFSDLHAHLMSIPFALLVIGLGLNLAVGWRRVGRVWDLTAASFLALTLGSLWLINTWDYPSYLLLSLALAGLAVYCAPGTAGNRLAWGLLLGAAIIVGSVLPYWPFHQAVETFGAGIEATKWRTPLLNYLAIHGLFLFIIVTFLVWQVKSPFRTAIRRWRGRKDRERADAFSFSRNGKQLPLFIYCGLALAAVIYLALAGYWTGAVLLLLLAFAGLAIWDGLVANAREGRVYAVFPLLLLAFALGLGLGVDLVRITDDIGRMNTFFKYYLEAWVLFALSAAYMLWRLGYNKEFHPVKVKGLRIFWLGAAFFLIFSSLIYTGLGAQARLADRFNPLPPTLDGMAYMEQAVHWEKDKPIELKMDAAAIRWLQDNLVGSPVVLEAHTDQYRWGSRIANYTGLPTVLGWPWHQIQQRGVYSSEVAVRAGHVRDMYETTEISYALKLMNQYAVKYVVVGELERIYYSEEGLAKFDKMVSQGEAIKAFDQGGVVIYQLLAPLAPTPTASSG